LGGLGAKLSAPFTLPLVAVIVASQTGAPDTLVTVTTIVGAGSVVQSDPPPRHPGSAPKNSDTTQRVNHPGGAIFQLYLVRRRVEAPDRSVTFASGPRQKSTSAICFVPHASMLLI